MFALLALPLLMPRCMPLPSACNAPGAVAGEEEDARGRRLGHVPARRVGVLSNDVAWALEEGGRVRSVDVRTGAVIATRDLPAMPIAASAGGGRLVISMEGGVALVLDGRELEVSAEFPGGEHVDVARDGERALTFGGALSGPRVHALPGGELMYSIDIPKRRLARAAWDASGTVVAAVDVGGGAHAWRDCRALELPRLVGITSVAVDPRGRWIAFGDEIELPEQPSVRLISAWSGEELASLPLQDELPFGGAIRRMTFDPTGEYLIATTGDFGTVQAWRRKASGWAVAWMHDYGGGNPSELLLLTDARSERVWVWGMMSDSFELATGRRLAVLADRGLTDFAPTPDGRTVAALFIDELVLLEADGRARFADDR